MMNTGSLRTVLESGQPVAGHRPWPRVIVTPEIWNALSKGLADGAWTLLGLWGEAGMAHLAAREDVSGTLGVASLPCPDGRFPSVGRCASAGATAGARDGRSGRVAAG